MAKKTIINVKVSEITYIDIEITWSSKRAFIGVFFFLRALANSSTFIDSVKASGPSSDIGGIASGWKYKN